MATINTEYGGFDTSKTRIKYKTGSAARTATETAEASGTAGPSSKGAANTKSGTTKAAKSGTEKTKAAPTKTSSVDPRLPPGGVNMITPSALAVTSYYKVSDYVTFAWNYTSLSVKPSRINAFVSCASNSATYAILNNATFEPTAKVIWDTKPEASGTAPLLTETYTLVVYDASKDLTAIPQAGHLGSYQQFAFGMYTPQPYTALSAQTTPPNKRIFPITYPPPSKQANKQPSPAPANRNSYPLQANKHSNLRYVQPTTQSQSSSVMPPSTSNPPPGWTAHMEAFLKRVLGNGEDTKSAIILLETEYPHMVGKVSAAWVERVKRGEV
ncbi:MAG: hypothetical protein LQ343_001067 [Gyalolechia ehrenbergii]|nr:MAG: hypothetical protein LQ343_001067 [Gyalolechia ehrenbergii]